jgi:hypothetical protein
VSHSAFRVNRVYGDWDAGSVFAVAAIVFALREPYAVVAATTVFVRLAEVNLMNAK